MTETRQPVPTPAAVAALPVPYERTRWESAVLAQHLHHSQVAVALVLSHYAGPGVVGQDQRDGDLAVVQVLGEHRGLPPGALVRHGQRGHSGRGRDRLSGLGHAGLDSGSVFTRGVGLSWPALPQGLCRSHRQPHGYRRLLRE
ncbi:hypothetical protein [Streptomyces scabiei]|uniref:hypothetical protein n=1 Tax=Streptomyces scabiei TaxID=1930 RepID=UPI0029B1DC09|nr:hypothetical protein [Streptomyces scabiei]MDX2863392.1 hypothetical protein [Streptomyces scabiei]